MPDFFIHMQSTYGDLWFPESRLKLAMFNFFRYPSQKEWQRKEQLYLKIIDYFERDKQWEHAIPLCKELSHLYEKKVFDYEKLSGILKKEASLFEKVISSSEEGLRLEPEYFRVGFYGKSFALFLRVNITILFNELVSQVNSNHTNMPSLETCINRSCYTRERVRIVLL